VDVTDAPLFLIAVIRPRPEHAAEVERELRALMAGTHAEEGCVFMELVVSDEDPTTWFMLEKFRSRADWDLHMQTEHVTRGNAHLADLLREPTELRLYSAK
jgi:quinol monooxygenase YgiN